MTPLHDSARWDLSALARKRPPRSVVLEGGLMADLIADVGRFIGDEDWHLSHNVPHRRGLLLHGNLLFFTKRRSSALDGL